MAFNYKEYEESDSVRKAADALANHNANKVADWSGGTYGDAIKDALEKIQNRESFSYDLNGDALYQQYKDQYKSLGKLAMQDTMGQAAALTGGYGNSYASTAGNQAYQQYLSQVNDKIPELYSLALSKYQAEGDQMQQNLANLEGMYSTEYGEYQDQVSRWNSDRDYLASLYDSERNYDYGKYTDDRNFAFTNYQQDESTRQWAEQMAYQRERDAVADAQWQKEYDLSRASASASGSGSGSTGGSASSTPWWKYLGYSDLSEGEDKLKAMVYQKGGKQTLKNIESAYKTYGGYDEDEAFAYAVDLYESLGLETYDAHIKSTSPGKSRLGQIHADER